MKGVNDGIALSRVRRLTNDNKLTSIITLNIHLVSCKSNLYLSRYVVTGKIIIIYLL